MSRKLPIEILTPEEVERLLRTCSSRAPTGIRDRALIGTLIGSGIRIGEALALKPRDLNLEKGTLNIRHGKGDRQRLAALSPTYVPMLREWLAVRDGFGIGGRHPVFCVTEKNRRGCALDPHNVRQSLRRRARKAGIEKRCNPHAFRHGHAVRLHTQGVPAEIVRRQLGHANLGTTCRYLSALSRRM